jgi:hypothetical protein
LDAICEDQDQYFNTKDPELIKIFEILAEERMIIVKKKFIEIISLYELSLSLEEFFSPIGEKQEISFIDFCSLFKCKNPSNEIFYRTFASSFQNANSTHVDTENIDMFPVSVIPK